MAENYQIKKLETLNTEFVGEHPELLFLEHYPTNVEYLNELRKKEEEFISSLN